MSPTPQRAGLPAVAPRTALLTHAVAQVPAFVKEKRFHNWLLDAQDWSVSRDRFWGTPLPIWVSEDGQEIVVVGSIEELKALTGATSVTDLHRDSIDRASGRVCMS